MVLDCTVQFTPNEVFEPFGEFSDDLIMKNDMY